MKTGKKGIDLIKEFEGFEAKPYLCPAKIPTIGYGATYYPGGKKVTLKDPAITEAEAVKLLENMLIPYEQAVEKNVKTALSQNQFDALVSFVYNVGEKNFKSSTLLKKVNKNPKDLTIEAEFKKWNKGGGKVLKGLVRRRNAESKLYFS